MRFVLRRLSLQHFCLAAYAWRQMIFLRGLELAAEGIWSNQPEFSLRGGRLLLGWA